jgi:hypothetical protein
MKIEYSQNSFWSMMYFAAEIHLRLIYFPGGLRGPKPIKALGETATHPLALWKTFRLDFLQCKAHAQN